VGPFPGSFWNEDEKVHSTQVILYKIFLELLERHPDWQRFFQKTKTRFSKGTWQKADSDLRQSYAAALAFQATGSLNKEYTLFLSEHEGLLALVDSWFRIFGPIIFGERIFENWDLSVIHRIAGATDYRHELSWMLESLWLVEGDIQVYTKETLQAEFERFLASCPDSKLTAGEFPEVAKVFLRGFPVEGVFLNFMSTEKTRIASRLKKPGLRALYQSLFFHTKILLIGKKALIDDVKAKKIEAEAKQKWLEEEGLRLALQFEQAIDLASGEAPHLKSRRQALVSAAIELFRRDSRTPWADFFKNSQPATLLLFVVQKIYEDPNLRAMIEPHYHLDSIKAQIVPIKVSIKKRGNLALKLGIPLANVHLPYVFFKT